MPSCGCSRDRKYYQQLAARRQAYREKLIAKGVMDGSNKMLTLMYRKGL